MVIIMSVAGKYRVTAATPDGNVDVIIELAESGGVYTGTLKAQGNTAELKDIKVDGGSFTSSAYIRYDYDSFNATVKGTVDGDAFKGLIVTPYMPVTISGKRV